MRNIVTRGKKSDDVEDAGANVIGIGGIGADLRTRTGTGDAIGNEADALSRSDLAIASSCEESTTAVTATPPVQIRIQHHACMHAKNDVGKFLSWLL